MRALITAHKPLEAVRVAIVACVIAVVWGAATVSVTAQTRVVHASGGGSTSSGTTISHGTLGQPLAGIVSSTSTSNPVGFWQNGEGKPPPPDTGASATIVVDSVTPDLGETFDLAIRLTDQSGLDAIGADSIAITLRFEGTCLEILSSFAVVYDGDTAEITVLAARSDLDGNVLQRLRLRARLGSVTGTVMRISNVAWLSAPSIQTKTRNGDVSIHGICLAGGRVRLVRNVGGATIRSVTPNPASDYVSLQVDAIALSMVTVSVVDMVGKVILVDDLLVDKSGVGTLHIKVADISQGIYSVRVALGTLVSSTSLVVTR